jgi:hypothetical protein
MTTLELTLDEPMAAFVEQQRKPAGSIIPRSTSSSSSFRINFQPTSNDSRPCFWKGCVPDVG